MALTVTINDRGVMGNKLFTRATIGFDTSYPTGGETLAAATLGMGTVEDLRAEYEGGYAVRYDHANTKLMVFQGDNNNAADAPGVEVPDTTDISAITDCRIFAIGH